MTAEFLSGNRLTLLNSGAEYFPALIAAIDKAQHEVHLESYIFEDDATGRAVAAAMADAARRGVTVRVLVDGFGAPEFAEQLQPALLAAGVQAMVYRPEIARLRLRRHRLRRLHRKLAMVDGEIAFVGGINIVDDSDRPLEMPPRYDYAVRIEGPLLQPMQRALHRLWELVLWAKLNRRYRLPKFPRQAPKARGEQTAAFLVRDNIRHRRDIEEAYLAGDRRRSGRNPSGQRLFPAWPPLPAGPARCGQARRAGNPRAAGAYRIPPPALRHAGALRQVAGRRHPHLRVSAQLPARQGRGHRPTLGNRRFIEHRSLQPAACQGSQRRGTRREVCQGTAAESPGGDAAGRQRAASR
jgi:hypothetical protein